MTVYTLFGQPASPATLAADTGDYDMGMQFTLSSAAALTGIWFYSAPGAGALPAACCIYQVTGQSQVAGTVSTSPSWSGAAGSGWVKCSYPGTVTLLASTDYRVVVFYGGGSNWYSATGHYWDTGAGSGGITSGIISAPDAASADGGNQDAFKSPASILAYPAASFNAANYWIDAEVTTAGGSAAVPFRGQPARPRVNLPLKKGHASGHRGVSSALIAGVPGTISVQAPAGSVQQAPVNIRGPAGKITLAAVVGTVTAVTGSPGRTARSRTRLPPPRRRGHGLPGTAGTAIAGKTGLIALEGHPGTVQAVTGSPGRTARSRTRIPPRHGISHGLHGTLGAVVPGISGQVTVSGNPAGISITVSGTAGTVAVTAPAGFVVLTPRRYAGWDIDQGFSCTEPRSHLTAGSPGSITVKAPSGTVNATQGTEGAADSARIARTRNLMPPRRGKAK